MAHQIGKLMMGLLAGLVIMGAAVFAVQPAMAAGYQVQQPARVEHVARRDVLNVRRWPAAHSQKVGELAPQSLVWVERCNIIAGTSDWCLVHRGGLSGWVNSRYLAPADMARHRPRPRR